jgi:hypothetical protein
LWAAAVYLSEILLLEMVFARNGTSIRYSTFVLAVAAPLIMWVWANLGAYPRIRRMFGAMIAVMVVLGALIFFKRYHREWTALALNSSRDAYYASVLPEYPVVREINRLHDGKAVMPIYNYDDYLIDVPYITAYRTYADGRDMKADCAARNIGYIFANNRLDTTENSAAYPEYPEKRIVFSANGYYLYRLDFPGGPR